jgi:hypothetical protein
VRTKTQALQPFQIGEIHYRMVVTRVRGEPPRQRTLIARGYIRMSAEHFLSTTATPVISDHCVDPIYVDGRRLRRPLVVIKGATKSWEPTDPALTSLGHDTAINSFPAFDVAFVMIVRDVLGHGIATK